LPQRTQHAGHSRSRAQLEPYLHIRANGEKRETHPASLTLSISAGSWCSRSCRPSMCTNASYTSIKARIAAQPCAFRCYRTQHVCAAPSHNLAKCAGGARQQGQVTTRARWPPPATTCRAIGRNSTPWNAGSPPCRHRAAAAAASCAAPAASAPSNKQPTLAV